MVAYLRFLMAFYGSMLGGFWACVVNYSTGAGYEGFITLVVLMALGAAIPLYLTRPRKEHHVPNHSA